MVSASSRCTRRWRGPVLLVSPLVSTYPLVTLAFAAVLLRSARVTIAHVIGVTTTVAGVMAAGRDVKAIA
jgi:drug/metabolite transporter (DMT)-like permease